MNRELHRLPGETGASARRSGGHMPNVFDAAYLTRRDRSEFMLLAVPTLVQRLVFPVLVAIGQLLGRCARARSLTVGTRSTRV